MISKRGTLALAFLFFIALFLISFVSAVPQLQTQDINGNPKYDYSPEQIVYVHGTGFNADQIAVVNITRPDSHLDSGIAFTDSQGSFDFIYDLDGIVGNYTLTATEGNNVVISSFTDANLWITVGACASAISKTDKYNIGQSVFLNGNGFLKNRNYSWSITGREGLSSCDSNTIVANGTITTNNQGAFCLNSYNIPSNDCGEYLVKFSSNNATYRVSGATCSQANECGTQFSELTCQGKNVVNVSIFPLCSSSSCQFGNSSQYVKTCSNFCSRGECFDGDAACVEARKTGVISGTLNTGASIITGKVINKANATFNTGLAIYQAPPGGLKKQVLFDSDTGFVSPFQNLTLSVTKPACKYQVDLFCGTLLNNFSTSTYNVRLILGDNTFSSGADCIPGNQSICGDGIKNATEQCDDGNTNNTDSCNNQCKFTICGDGVKNPGEQCDDGNLNNTDSCNNQCKFTLCGNGIKEGSELCDDGNLNNNDLCTNQCTPTICGDGVKQTPNGAGQFEQCDDGNLNNTDSCTNQCTTTFCGDGIIQKPNTQGTFEQCDDGNNNNDDQCNNQCQICIDKDKDGICDTVDQCPDTPANETVNEDGCDFEDFCTPFFCSPDCFTATFISANNQTIGRCTVVMRNIEGTTYRPECVPASQVMCLNTDQVE